MAFFKKKETKIINSKTDHTIMTDFTPEIKKKVFIGFSSKRKKEHTHSNSKDIGSINTAEQFIPRLDAIPSMEKTIQLHENIDVFLEKIGNERLRNDIVDPKDEQLQELHTMNDEIRREEEEFVTTKGEVEVLLSEVEIRSRLVEDLEHQILERQTQLVEKTEMVKRLQSQLEIRDQTVIKLNKEFEEKEEKLSILQDEVKERNKMIQDIQGQLTEKLTWIVENNHFTEQLSRELKQKNRLFEKIQEELKRRNEELNVSGKELTEIKEEMDELHNEILSRNKIIETIEKQLEEQQITLIEKTQLVETLQGRIKERNEEITTQKQNAQELFEAFHIEVETRNKIIENIRKQLTENQTIIVEHTNAAEQLQEELGRSKQFLQETQDKLEQNQQDLIKKDNELLTQGLQLQKVCAELDMVRGEIDSRNRIIENIEEQLAEEQTHLVEKTQLAEHLQGELEHKQKKMRKN
jgi:chromosome segregation ATPase